MSAVNTQSPSVGEARGACSQTASADAASAQLRQIPHFQYDPPKVGRSTHGAITVNCYIFHQIADMDAFYVAMGYGKTARDSGLCGEEFIWERYTRDGAKMSKQSLQTQIAVYLHKHSAKFKVLYGQTYAALLEKCDSSNIDDTDQHCIACPMHPRLEV